MLKRAAVVGAAATAAAPLIETVIIPTAAAHASTPGTAGSGSGGGSGSGNTPPAVQIELTGTLSNPLAYTVTGTSSNPAQTGTLSPGYEIFLDAEGHVLVQAAQAGDAINPPAGYVVGVIYGSNYSGGYGGFEVVTGGNPTSITFVDATDPFFSQSGVTSDSPYGVVGMVGDQVSLTVAPA